MSDAHGSGTPHDSPTESHPDAPIVAHGSEAHQTVDEAVAALGPAGESDEADRADDEAQESLAAQVEQPAKVMRIGTMIKQLLEEVRAAPLDEAGRRRLADIHAASIRELESGLAPELREELDRLTLPFADDDGYIPSEAELRIAQAQLVGWLEGLFHGIQTALFAQQMAARAQLEEMRRRALPAGGGGQQAVIVGPGGQIIGTTPGSGFGGMGAPGDDREPGHGTGQYL